MQQQLHQLDNLISTTYATTTSSTWQLNINDIYNNNFINLTTYMHEVPIRASSPQHKSINTLTGHQALNVKSISSQGIKPPTEWVCMDSTTYNLNNIDILYDSNTLDNILQLYNLNDIDKLLTTLKKLTTTVVTTTTATSHHNLIFINHKQCHITTYLNINNSSYNIVFKHQQFII